MSGNSLLIDTNILLYLLGGDESLIPVLEDKQIFCSIRNERSSLLPVSDNQKSEVRGQRSDTSNEQPETSNQKPATRNQKPATSNGAGFVVTPVL